MHHRHQRAHDARRVAVLDDIAAINNAPRALFQEALGALEDLGVADFAAAADEQGDVAGGLDDFVVAGDVVGRVGFDDIGAEFHGLADEMDDLGFIAIDHVAAGLGIRAEDEGLDHHGDPVVIALDLESVDVFDALLGDIRGAGDLEEIHAHAGGIQAHGLEHGLGDHARVAGIREFAAVDIGHIHTEDEARLVVARSVLQMPRLAGGQLDGIRARRDEGGDGLGDILDAGEEAGLVKETVIHGDIEAASGLGVKEAVEANGFHKVTSLP